MIRFISFTLVQAILTVILSLLIGLPSGYLLARSKPYFPSLVRTMLTVPFLYPPLAVLLGFVSLFGQESYLTRTFADLLTLNPYSFWGIIAAHTLYNISVIARISEGAFRTEPEEFHEVAETLGASLWFKVRTITLPHIRPALESSILLVFMYAFNSFAIVLILGQVKLQTIEVVIYTQSRLLLNYETSSILVVLQLLINLTVILLYTRRRTYAESNRTELYHREHIDRRLSSFLLSVVIIITWLPIIVLAEKTITGLIDAPAIFRQQIFSGEYDRLLGTSSIRVIFNTIFFGMLVSLFSLLFSSLLALSSHYFDKRNKMSEKIFGVLTLIPMGTSAITISLGLLITHGRSPAFNTLVWVYIISAQLIAALPFTSRMIFSSWNRVPRDLILISSTLGASGYTTFEKVVLPFMKPAILVAILFSFAISIGEFGATYYLARGEWITLSLAIHKMFASRNVILPYIYALMLVITSFVLFWIIEKMGSVEMEV